MATSIQIIAIFFLAVTGLTCNFVKASFKEGECKFCYSLQPPTTPNCNPYSQDKIQLNCKVKGPLGAELDIKWFFKSKQPEGTAMELENIAPFGIHKTIVSVNNTVLIKSNLAISNLTVGEYWCQVYHMDNALLKSQIFGVATKGDYSRDDDCAENVSFSVESEKCADIGQNNKLEGESYTCPLTQSTIHSPTSQLQDFKTRTLIPSVVSVESTLKMSQNTNSRIISPTLSPQSTVIITSLPRLLSTNQPSSDPAGLMEKPSNQLWLYVVVGLSGVFLFLIFILTIVFVLLCLTGPQHHRKRKLQRLSQRQRLDTLSSPVTTDPPSRPLTAMTIQTDILTNAFPVIQESSVVYDSLDQDYEDIDEDNGKEQCTNAIGPMTSNPRYHEQGPTAAATNHLLQPIYTIPTQSPDLVQYSEIGNEVLPKEGFPPSGHLQMHGYGKLDHSRPRQNYYPKKDSPLLSGYRKLDHVNTGCKATTLPHGIKSPGYANIEISPSGNGNHLRSASLPSSEYSNLNTSSISQPCTPTGDSPVPSRKYKNFEIIQAYDGEHFIEAQLSDSRRGSEDYHMLSDATIDRNALAPSVREEYEFLPVCVCEDDEEGSLQSPSSLHLQLGQEFERALMKKGLSSLGRELMEEKMSLASQSSADFTGPFFFPHMSNFEGPLSPEHDRHVYRALDVSTMEPKKGYAMISVKDN